MKNLACPRCTERSISEHEERVGTELLTWYSCNSCGTKFSFAEDTLPVFSVLLSGSAITKPTKIKGAESSPF